MSLSIRHPIDVTARRFLIEQEAGAVTVEFVIILPILLAILLLVVSGSLLFAAASDVQQLAHELARAGIWVFLDAQDDIPGRCTVLVQQSLESIVSGLPTIYTDAVRRVDCYIDQQMLRVEVEYDLSNNFGQFLGRVIGLNVDAFTRFSAIRL